VAPALNIQTRIILGDEIVFGPGKADLLGAIKINGSFYPAGKQLDRSYSRAWALVNCMNRHFNEALGSPPRGIGYWRTSGSWKRR
jgi:molybdate transport system regulatory protein